MTYRPVRPTPEFFAELDAQLGEERGPGGEPSRYDFLAFELPGIIEAFANGWDGLPVLIPGRVDYRVLVAVGRLVPAYAVDALLTASGTIELLRLRLQLTWPDIPKGGDGYQRALA